MTSEYIIYLALCISALMIIVFLFILSVFSGNLKKRLHFYFFLMVMSNLVGITSEGIVELMTGHTGNSVNIIIRVADFISYGSGGVQCIAFGLYLYEYLGTKVSLSKKIFKYITLLGIASICLSVIASITHLYVYFDEYNNYIQQRTYWISNIIPSIILLICMSIALYYKKVLKKREWISLLLYTVIPIFCYVIELFLEDIYMGAVGGAFTTFLIYVNIQVELRKQLEIQESELTEKRISIMLSQIQPHFLYNVLGTIDNLIYVDPDLAHQAVLDFSNYLRSNMDALSQRELIPFFKEMEHTRQYLRLEQLRFRDRLEIEYDIHTENFMLPVLTIQPIVENAVRYGATKRRNGGKVIIQTREMADCYCIKIIDNGTGFDVKLIRPDGRSHTGIDNVRNRLESTCGGVLKIESTIGVGTISTIEIPKTEEAKS